MGWAEEALLDRHAHVPVSAPTREFLNNPGKAVPADPAGRWKLTAPAGAALGQERPAVQRKQGRAL